MAFNLTWRRVALACVLVMAAAAVLALRSSPGADAQEPASATFVFSGIDVSPSNGHANLGAGTGSDAGTLGVACTGAAPRSGTRIVGQVVTQLLPSATVLRILRNDGAAITGAVQVNCVVELEVTPTGTRAAERFKALASTR
ncbi:MAG TPA: hypothetical protein VKD21_11565 [Acidimicrobiales bacterium]|nr:hypothetical protein [Acidimicrobiales bacterium]